MDEKLDIGAFTTAVASVAVMNEGESERSSWNARSKVN